MAWQHTLSQYRAWGISTHIAEVLLLCQSSMRYGSSKAVYAMTEHSSIRYNSNKGIRTEQSGQHLKETLHSPAPTWPLLLLRRREGGREERGGGREEEGGGREKGGTGSA
eukprot:2030299-Rhodomonas_salina.1